MKSSEILDYALPRANLQKSVAADRVQGLFYLNIAVDLLENEVEAWDWLFKTTSLNTEASTRLYSLDSGALEVFEFWNETDNIPMEKISPEDAVSADPNRNDTGSVRKWFIEGVDDSTGLWQVGFWRIPSAVNTIRYSFYKSISDLTDDSTNDLITAGLPKTSHPVLLFWTAELLLSEYGLSEDEDKEAKKRAIALSNLKRRNGRMNNTRGYRMQRRDSGTKLGRVNVDGIDGV